MKTKFCIATTKKPIEFGRYIKMVAESAETEGKAPLKLLGYTVCEGSGCYNHGIFIEGQPEIAEEFIKILTMVLQPAKYGRVSTDDPGVLEGQFEMKIDPTI